MGWGWDGTVSSQEYEQNNAFLSVCYILVTVTVIPILRTKLPDKRATIM